MRRSLGALLFLAACGPRIEFTPHSALQAQSMPRVCEYAVELFEGDVPMLEQAQAARIGKLDISGAYEREDLAQRAAEYGATHVVKIAEQRQLLQSGSMMFGTGGPGFYSGMAVPTVREETYVTYAIYRADLERVPDALRCAPPSAR